MMQVIKRNGAKTAFDEDKIIQAINKANNDINENLDQAGSEIASEIHILAEKSDGLSVYEIQGLVENKLMAKGYPQTSKNYTLYRLRKDMDRLGLPDIEGEVSKLIAKDPSVVHENANKDSNVFNTYRDLTAGSVAKAIGSKTWPEAVWQAHVNGDIHLHDSDFFPYSPMTNCNVTNYQDMLHNGFELNGTHMGTPGSIGVATRHLAMIIQSIASVQYGGQTIADADVLLAPFAEKNYQKHQAELAAHITDVETLEMVAFELTRKDIYKAMEGLEYDINSLSSSSGQTPFVSLGFGRGTNRFEREIQQAILKVRLHGLGESDDPNKNKTAIFPKLLFVIKDGVNLKPDDPNYDVKHLALECTAKRIYPDYLFEEKIIDITGSFKFPMGCRSFLQGWVDPETGEYLNEGRANAGVQTVNLPRIALESAGDFEKFWEIFDERLDLLHEAAAFRINFLRENLKSSMAPILFEQGALTRTQAGENAFDKAFGNRRGTISLGYIGLHEVATIMYGTTEWHQIDGAKDFTVEILQRMKDKADQWGEAEGVHYSNYGTPSESLTDKFCRLDRAKFGDIEGVTDKEYYTNSFHFTTEQDITPFEKIDFEAAYPKLTSGGFISYVEAPSLVHNLKGMEAIIDYAYDKLGYLGVNSPIDKCFECGFNGDFKATEQGFECPSCGNSNPATSQVVKRLCGYLGEPNSRPIVRGRKKEIESRVKHM